MQFRWIYGQHPSDAMIQSYMEKAVGNMSIEAARAGFEASFEEADFYNKQTQDENHMHFVHSFDSEIRFPKKKSTAEEFEEVLCRHEKSIIESYRLTQTEDEIWITEQVNNLLFTLT